MTFLENSVKLRYFLKTVGNGCQDPVEAVGRVGRTRTMGGVPGMYHGAPIPLTPGTPHPLHAEPAVSCRVSACLRGVSRVCPAPLGHSGYLTTRVNPFWEH